MKKKKKKGSGQSLVRKSWFIYCSFFFFLFFFFAANAIGKFFFHYFFSLRVCTQAQGQSSDDIRSLPQTTFLHWWIPEQFPQQPIVWDTNAVPKISKKICNNLGNFFSTLYEYILKSWCVISSKKKIEKKRRQVSVLCAGSSDKQRWERGEKFELRWCVYSAAGGHRRKVFATFSISVPVPGSGIGNLELVFIFILFFLLSFSFKVRLLKN